MFSIKKSEKLDDILNKVYSKNRLARYSNLIVGCFLMAISFNLFFLPLNIVHGGVSGISIVTERLFGIEPSIFSLNFKKFNHLFYLSLVMFY